MGQGRGRDGLLALLLLGLGLLVGGGGWFLWSLRNVPLGPAALLRPAPSPPALRVVPAPACPCLALVIDDLGYRGRQDRALLDLPIPLTFAVLPYGPDTTAFSREAVRRGFQVILHMPMEPESSEEDLGLGPGALWVSMSPLEVTHALETALAALPQARGVSNHMGSRFTADARSMEAVADVLAEAGLFFLDSRTTPWTVAARVARARGVPTAERNVFLDLTGLPGAATLQGVGTRMALALETARRRGRAVAIGHPLEPTIEVLRQAGVLAGAAGVQLVFLYNLVEVPSPVASRSRIIQKNP